MAEPVIIRIGDIRAANHCVRGAKRWFDSHGMSFSDFVKNGMASDELLKRSRNDALAVEVIGRTLERMKTNG